MTRKKVAIIVTCIIIFIGLVVQYRQKYDGGEIRNTRLTTSTFNSPNSETPLSSFQRRNSGGDKEEVREDPNNGYPRPEWEGWNTVYYGANPPPSTLWSGYTPSGGLVMRIRPNAKRGEPTKPITIYSGSKGLRVRSTYPNLMEIIPEPEPGAKKAANKLQIYRENVAVETPWVVTDMVTGEVKEVSDADEKKRLIVKNHWVRFIPVKGFEDDFKVEIEFQPQQDYRGKKPLPDDRGPDTAGGLTPLPEAEKLAPLPKVEQDDTPVDPETIIRTTPTRSKAKIIRI